MSTSNDVPELLRRGIEAARDNKRSEARELFEKVVELDDKNEKGWFWLASVVDSDDERRICLGNVLHINPNNERAKRALDALQVKAKETKSVNEESEVVAGVTRRQMTAVVGVGAVLVILILFIALVVVIGNNNRQGADHSTETAVAQVATEGRQTSDASALQATAASAASTGTAAALITPVEPTRNVPTLPPTWTPTPMATLPPTRETLALPTGLTGRLAMWGGQDMLSVGFLPVGYYDFDNGSKFNVIGKSLGKNISFAINGERVVYAEYDPLLFSTSLEAINLNGTQIESLPERWQGQTVLEPQMPRYGGPFTQYVTFVARTDKRQTTQVFVLDLSAPQGTNPLRQLTDDDTIYTDPAMSPDGKKVIAVRSNPNVANPTLDLVNIDVATGSQIPVTNDGASYTESSPFYTKDGSQVVFAAAPSNDPNNNDIYIRNADGSGSSLPFYRDANDDINPVLSPDGKFLAFASNPGGAYDIYVYDVSAAKLSQLTDTPDNEYPGDWWQP